MTFIIPILKNNIVLFSVLKSLEIKNYRWNAGNIPTTYCPVCLYLKCNSLNHTILYSRDSKLPYYINNGFQFFPDEIKEITNFI